MPVSGVLERLYNYWQTLPTSGENSVPALGEIQPTELHELLPRFSLMKRVNRYNVQVSKVGTADAALWKAPLAGINAFDLTAPTMRENAAKLYEAILGHPSGVHMLETVVRQNGKPAEVASLYLPLADTDGKPTLILGCSVYVKQPQHGRLNARLMLDHQKITHLEFLDLGRGKPQVQFDRPTPRPRHEESSRWWDRFMPSRPRPARDSWLDA